MRDVETIDEKEAIRFLLSDLPEENRSRFEERFFQDDKFYQQLVALQEELADDYVHDKLSPGDRTQFEKTFLRSARRRERVEFAAAFSRALASYREPAVVKLTPAIGWLESLRLFFTPLNRATVFASALLIALLFGAVWLVVENRRLANTVREAKLENDALVQKSGVSNADATRKQQDLEREIAALRTQGSEMEAAVAQKERELEALKRTKSTEPSGTVSRVIASFVLQPGLKRGTDEPETLIIPANARSIQIQLDLEREEDFQAYMAEIRTARGNLAWSRGGLALQKTNYGSAVVLTVPAAVVSPGEYEVTLSGVSGGKSQAVGYYYFLTMRR